MAQALECPACGARHRLDTIPDKGTFRCDRCGQVLKVPDSVAARRAAETASSAGPVRGGSAAAGAAKSPNAEAPATAPPPRRRGAPTSVGPTVSATTTAALPVVAADGAEPPTRRGREVAPSRPGPARRTVGWWWRVLAWFVAVPLGLVVTAWPALQLDLLKKDDLLDVFVGSGLNRYARLLVFAAVWALVTALLVQLFVEGARWFKARRRVRAA